MPALNRSLEELNSLVRGLPCRRLLAQAEAGPLRIRCAMSVAEQAPTWFVAFLVGHVQGRGKCDTNSTILCRPQARRAAP